MTVPPVERQTTLAAYHMQITVGAICNSLRNTPHDSMVLSPKKYLHPLFQGHIVKVYDVDDR